MLNKYNSQQKYYLDHEVCPKCNNGKLFKTDMFYFFSKFRDFKDLNSANCLNKECSWSGIVDDLVPYKPDLIEICLNNYYANHKYCPNCNLSDLTQTCAGMIPDPNNLKNYADTNSCTCSCGWRGIVDDLIEERK